jgi:hydroxyacylglutathione hydrolase
MAILVKRVINRPVDSNCFVIYQNGGTRCIVIDPGTSDCAELFFFFQEQILVPDYIFLTHEHFDHLRGVNKLKDRYGCKIVCSKLCSDKIVDRKKNMSVFYDQVGFQSYPADIFLEDINNRIVWNDTEFEFIDTRGHTKCSVCISVENKLFTGDTIIKNHKTVIKFPGGNKEELMQSLDHLFLKFRDKNTLVFPGHGECFLLEEIVKEQLV